MDFTGAWLLTIAIEGPFLYLLFRGRYGTPFILLNAVIASSLTLPFIWFMFPALGGSWGLRTAAGEAFAVFAETGFYIFVFRGLGAKEALLASALCNWLSFIVGLASP